MFADLCKRVCENTSTAPIGGETPVFRGSTARKLAHFSRKITLTTPYVNVAFNRGGFVPRHLSAKLAKYIRFSCPNAKLFQFSVLGSYSLFFFFLFFYLESRVNTKETICSVCRSFVIKINLNPSLSWTQRIRSGN